MGSSNIGAMGFLGAFYRIFHLGENPINKFNSSHFYVIFQEGIKNAIAHGPKEKEFFEYGLFLGDEGICQGFRDFGDYFKSEEIKKIWENKISRESTNKSSFSGKGIGNEAMYELSDLIEVDIEKGILYCTQSHELLGIIPKKLK
jgi:hypothetical protein